MFRLNPYSRARDPAPGWDLTHFDAPCADVPPTPSIPNLQPDPWAVEWARYGERCMAADAGMFAAMHPALEHLIWIAGQEKYAVDGLCSISRGDGHTEVTT
jgi:hypothetical protein